MSETKDFPTADVLSTITGRLMSEDIGGVYRVLEWMCGHAVWTHQLPRIGREARPVLVNRQPALQKAIDEAEAVTPENWREWLARWEQRYGQTIAVPKFHADDHDPIDPLSELAEKVGPDKIVVVKP